MLLFNHECKLINDESELIGELGMTPKEERQTMMFSAVLPEIVQRTVGALMKDYLMLSVAHASGDIEQTILQVKLGR